MKQYRYIISGGGTGGHIYPAIAIANEIKKNDPYAIIHFVGAHGKMEMEKIPQAGYSITGLWISGFHRGKIIKNILFPLKLVMSVLQAVFLVLKFRPDLTIGTGGFASGPVLFVASLLGRKIFLQEQNSFAGITNKILARRASGIAVAYPKMDNYFPKDKIFNTGNPVREALLEISSKREKAYSFFELNPAKKTLVVIGGSLGAQKINEMIAFHLLSIKALDLQLVWQCGKMYYNHFRAYHNKEDVKVYDFINEMDLLYATADIIVSRAGAGSVSELCVVGKPIMLIPSPNVAENHQYYNAKSLSDKGAAIMIEEKNIENQFITELKTLIQSPEKQLKMQYALGEFAKPHATKDIVKCFTPLIRDNESNQ